MPTRKNVKHIAICVTGCVTIGVIASLLIAQRIWLDANSVRAKSYAQSILEHAETVANSVTQALITLNNADNIACSTDDLERMRSTVFEQPFIRDAGRIVDGTIICTALWGDLPVPFTVKEKGRVTKNHVTLWGSARSYSSPNSTMDISSKGNFFVATSTAAFAAYNQTRASLSANITSPDARVIMRTFGDQEIINLENSPIRLCSSRFDFCINAAVQNSIFSSERAKILAATTLAGTCFGILLWYSITQLIKSQNSMASRLKKAILTNSIDLHYQPIVFADSGSISGCEALARWHDKKKGTVPPDIFIKLAEEIGLSNSLSKVIISKALQEFKKILTANPGIYLSVNLSTSELASEEILNHLCACCKEHGIPNSQIAIELLETSTIELSSLQKCIENYHRKGYLIFIDDFGTGYSSLSYLSHLKIDKIKIDKVFTQSAGINASADFILSQIEKIAKSTGANIIYEGIETQAQRKVILGLNKNALAQGWLYSKAVPIKELEHKLGI